MRPYYEENGIQLFHGDCREILPGLSFDALVYDPPYGLNLQLGRRNGTIRGDGDRGIRDWAVQGFSCPQILFGSPYVDRPRLIDAVLIWDKSELTGMGDLEFPWKCSHEEIYVIGSGFKSVYRRGSVLRHPLRPAWTNHPDSVSNEHPTEKPLSLMLDLLECCPWQIIADPFSGTGSTLAAAKQQRKRAIGIEIEEKYCEIAAKRLSQSVFHFSPETETEPELQQSLLGPDEEKKRN